MPQLVLSLPAGVVRNSTPATSQGRWYDANLVRWRGGGLAPVGGWERLTGTALGSIPRAIRPWTDNSGVRHVAVACDNHLYVETSSVFFNATPTNFVGRTPSQQEGGYGADTYGTSTYGTPREGSVGIDVPPYAFSLSTWGQELLAVFGSDGRLLRWQPTLSTNIAAPITGAPSGNRAMVVTPERHVMLIGADGNPRRIAWSSREDYTDWNFASTTNTAGFLDVDGPAPLLGAAVVRDGVLVFSEADVWLVRYVGLPFLYGAERIGVGVAPISPLAVGVFGGQAAWMGHEGFWQYNGGAIQPLRCDVQDFIYDSLNRQYARFNVAGGPNGLFPELWWFYPDTNATDGECNRYLIYNYAEDWWSIGSVGRSCVAEAGVYRYPLAADKAGNVYQHEVGYLAEGASRVGSVFAESGALSLGAGDRVMSISRAQPDSLEGPTASRLTIKGQFTREGAETQFGPYIARSDGYTDVRLSARDVRVRLEAAFDDNWTVGAMRLQVQPRGGR